jgi:outer membrane protein TolC
VKKTISVALFLLIFSFPAWAAAPAIPQGPTLTLEECLQLAFDHHPDIVSSGWQVRRSGSQVQLAKSSLRPALDLGASLSDSGSAEARSASDISVKQLLSDGGKTRATIAGASYNLSAARKEAERTWQERAYAVKEAYFGLLRARDDAEVAVETVVLYETQLKQAQAFYKAGSSSKIDVTTAEVNLSQARLDLAKARSSASAAVAGLENEIGTALPDRSAALQAPGESTASMPALETAVGEALSSRPDVQAAGERVLSAKETLSATARGMSPSLYASGGWGFSDSSSGWSDEWTASLSLSVPLYDGGATAARTEVSRADLEISRSDREKLLNSVRLEVETALLDLGTASEQVKTAELALRQARENLDLARGRYRVGVGTSLEVTDAAEKFSTAGKALVQARYDRQVAAAALEKALGRPVEIPKEETK